MASKQRPTKDCDHNNKNKPFGTKSNRENAKLETKKTLGDPGGSSKKAPSSSRKPLHEIQSSQKLQDEGPVEHRLSTKKYTVTKQSSTGTITTVTKKCSSESLTAKPPSSNMVQLENEEHVTVRRLSYSPVEWNFSDRDFCSLIRDDENEKNSLPTAKKTRQPIDESATNAEKKSNEKPLSPEIIIQKPTLSNDEQVSQEELPSNKNINQRLSLKNLPVVKVSKYISYFNCILNHDNPEVCKPLLVEAKPTPKSKVCTPVEHPRIKNIKKSLKRPHSRELMQLGSGGSATFKNNAKSSININYLDHLLLDGNAVTNEDQVKYQINKVISKEYMPLILEHLLKKELQEDFSGLNDVFSASSFNDIHRSVAINWIFRINDHYNGSPNLVHAAVRFFDKCLVQESIAMESLQLIAATCYWIVQKQLVTPHTAKSIARNSGNTFKPSDLINSERYVLRRLTWPQIPTTCDDFISYLAWISKHRNLRYIVQAARFLSLSALLNITLAAMKPSELSFACVALALKMFSDDRDESLSRLEATNLYFPYSGVQTEILRTVEVLCQPGCSCPEPFMIYQRPEKLAIAARIAKIIKAFK